MWGKDKESVQVSLISSLDNQMAPCEIGMYRSVIKVRWVGWAGLRGMY